MPRHLFFPPAFPFFTSPTAPLFLSLPFPINSKCPAFCPSIRSVCAVNPLVNFLFIFICFWSLLFFGLMVRAPFFVMPVEVGFLEGFVAGFLRRPCAILGCRGRNTQGCWRIFCWVEGEGDKANAGMREVRLRVMEGKKKLKLESMELRFEPWRIERKIFVPFFRLVTLLRTSTQTNPRVNAEYW